MGDLTAVSGMTLPEVNRDHRPDLIKIIEAMPFARRLEISVVGLAQGQSVLMMPAAVDWTFDGQHLMGGLTGTLADMAAVSAAMSAREAGCFGSTTGFTVQMIAPAAGEAFVAVGTEISGGKSSATASANVFAIRGNKASLVLTCLATARLMRV